MAEVKWIKIVTDVFDDEKIRYIETLPNGDTTIVIWFRIICLAGKSNHNGLLMMTDRIAYTEEMLSSIFRRDIKEIQFALKVFANLEMIEIIDNIIYLSNWDKHQSLDKLEHKKAYDREYQRIKRDEKLKSLENRATIVRANNDNRIVELELEEEKEYINNKPQKSKYGSGKNVLLTNEEYDRLKKDYSDIDKIIEWFSMYILEKGYKSKSHNLSIRRWVVTAYNKNETGTKRIEHIPDYTHKTEMMTEEEIEALKERLKKK